MNQYNYNKAKDLLTDYFKILKNYHFYDYAKCIPKSEYINVIYTIYTDVNDGKYYGLYNNETVYKLTKSLFKVLLRKKIYDYKIDIFDDCIKIDIEFQ